MTNNFIRLVLTQEKRVRTCRGIVLFTCSALPVNSHLKFYCRNEINLQSKCDFPRILSGKSKATWLWENHDEDDPCPVQGLSRLVAADESQQSVPLVQGHPGTARWYSCLPREYGRRPTSVSGDIRPVPNLHEHAVFQCEGNASRLIWISCFCIGKRNNEMNFWFFDFIFIQRSFFLKNLIYQIVYIQQRVAFQHIPKT